MLTVGLYSFFFRAYHAAVDPDKFADWTKYSKSDVIMKMMTNMGFVPGQGLGAKKQGIIEPVQAVVRPGRAAVGAYGKEAKGPKYGGLFSVNPCFAVRRLSNTIYFVNSCLKSHLLLALNYSHLYRNFYHDFILII